VQQLQFLRFVNIFTGPCPERHELRFLGRSKTPSPRPCVIFHNKLLVSLSDELFAPRPIPIRHNYYLSAVRDCLFNIFAATFHICRPFSLSTTLRRAMACGIRTHDPSILPVQDHTLPRPRGLRDRQGCNIPFKIVSSLTFVEFCIPYHKEISGNVDPCFLKLHISFSLQRIISLLS
jgi:hypothetical protein